MSYSNHLLLINIAVFVFTALTPLITTYAEPPPPSSIVISPHCSEKCGNIRIPYPFGIEEDCYFKDAYYSFKITCNHTTSPPTPIFGENLEVLNISVTHAELRSKIHVSYDCYNQTGYPISRQSFMLKLASFTISSRKNVFVAIGCDTTSWFYGFRQRTEYKTGCMTKCLHPEDVIDGECSGIGCCQANLPPGVKNIRVDVNSYNNHSSVYGFNPCSISFPIEKDAFRFSIKNLSLTPSEIQGSRETLFENVTRVPVVFNWTIGTENCAAARANDSFLCKENAECYDAKYQVGYRCRCMQGFAGNPYLPLGCTDIDECKEGKHNCQKKDYCSNTQGGFYCKCPEGHLGNGTRNDPCISHKNTWIIPVLVTAGELFIP